MTSKNTITINGRRYDALSGLPLDEEVVAPVKVASAKPKSIQRQTAAVRRTDNPHKQKVHRSKTLRRDIVRRPVGTNESIVVRHKTTPQKVQKSPQITRFAPQQPTKPKTTPVNVADHHVAVRRVEKKPAIETISPLVQAVHDRAAKHQHAKTATAAKPALSARELKSKIIADSMAHAAPPTKVPKRKRSILSRPLRASTLAVGSLTVIVLGAYFTYLNMPSLSVRVAAAQSGINATYPGYTPSGYRFDGPVAYNDGEVKLAFAANGGTTHYSINQKETTWDSQAVLDNYVAQKTDSYVTNAAQGLTIYTYSHGAAWVNHGVFYAVEGDAPLSTDQVLRIATSM